MFIVVGIGDSMVNKIDLPTWVRWCRQNSKITVKINGMRASCFIVLWKVLGKGHLSQTCGMMVFNLDLLRLA